MSNLFAHEQCYLPREFKLQMLITGINQLFNLRINAKQRETLCEAEKQQAINYLHSSIYLTARNKAALLYTRVRARMYIIYKHTFSKFIYNIAYACVMHMRNCTRVHKACTSFYLKLRLSMKKAITECTEKPRENPNF